MPYKRKYRSRPYRKSRRGKYGRRMGRASFQTRVKRVVMKAAETKYKDVGVENVQLYHNLGATTLLAPGNVTSIAALFNPWSTIQRGVERNMRVGDRITPRGMSMKVYMANKYDRPHTHIRLIVCTIPKAWNGSATTPVFYPFQVTPSGNNMLRPCDKDKGVKFFYDKIFKISNNGWWSNPSPGFAKEPTKYVKIWIKRKRANDIIFDSSLQEIVNKPLAVYAIPYEQYGTIETDNIASIAIEARMYFKDI